MYDDGRNSIAEQFNYEQQYPEWLLGQPIETNKMYNLTEDGIRAYTGGTKIDGSYVRTGSIRVEDTKVTNMRGCITTPLAAEPSYIRNVTTEGCSIGYALANNSSIINSRGDAAYGPLLHSTYDTRKNTKIELTLLNNPSTGAHPLAYIAGAGHDITFKTDGTRADTLREIRVGDTGLRWIGNPEYQSASNITIMNNTSHPLVLTKTSQAIEGSSMGQITDFGSKNKVRSF